MIETMQGQADRTNAQEETARLFAVIADLTEVISAKGDAMEIRAAGELLLNAVDALELVRQMMVARLGGR